jgi:hypothetical protein
MNNYNDDNIIQILTEKPGLKALKSRPIDCSTLFESIKQSVGRWQPPAN